MKRRGITINPAGRFEVTQTDLFDDGWGVGPEARSDVQTRVVEEEARSIISRNDSPDLPFDRSTNPYRGCEHGCVYCFARPSHAYLGHSPGLDFETVIYAKRNAARVLSDELDKPGYRPETLVLGANTDPYQPVERRHEITRDLLTVLLERKHPVSITTKATSILRDLDILEKLAAENLVHVFLSASTLDHSLAGKLEPRAAAPRRRLEVLQILKGSGISVGLLCSPVIPGLTDFDIERVIQKGHEAGATVVGYSLLRLPHELKQIFESWLHEHYPERAQKVLHLIRETRQGQLNDSSFETRQSGAGVYAQMIRQRFDRVVAKLGLNEEPIRLNKHLFVGVPQRREKRGQMPLF